MFWRSEVYLSKIFLKGLVIEVNFIQWKIKLVCVKREFELAEF